MQEAEQTKQATVQWFRVTLIIAAVLLGAGYLFRLLTPTQVALQPTLETNYKGTLSSFEAITFIGNAPSIPNELAVATAENFAPFDFEDRSTKQKIIERYNLQLHPEVPTLWMSPSYALQVIEATGSYELSTLVPLPTGKLVDSLRAQQVATEFLNSVFPENNLQILTNKIVYREADVHGDIVEASDAGLMEIPFGYSLEGYPVLLERSVLYPVTITINADNQLQKAVFQPFFLTPTVSGRIKTLTIPQAIANINDDRATIISSHYQGFESEALDTIQSGSLHTVTIEYRVSPDTKLIVPYYRFAGQLKNTADQEFFAEIITPAVQTQEPQP